jgi:hypothetical protein
VVLVFPSSQVYLFSFDQYVKHQSLSAQACR